MGRRGLNEGDEKVQTSSCKLIKHHRRNVQHDSSSRVQYDMKVRIYSLKSSHHKDKIFPIFLIYLRW